MRIRTIIAAAAMGAAVIAAAAMPAAAVAQGPAAPAAASASLELGNWAGYWARPPGSQPLLQAGATFTVPDVSHQPVTGLAPYTTALWAGIGGLENSPSQGRAGLEQAGLFIRKQWPWSKPEYDLFWQVLPDKADVQPFTTDDKAPAKNGSNWAHVRPGDTVTAEVVTPAESASGKWEFRIVVNADKATFRSYTKVYDIPASRFTGTTAEAITEWCSGPAQPKPPDWLIRAVEDKYGPRSKEAVSWLNSGFLGTGAVRYTGATYLTRFPGDAKPAPVALTQHRITLHYQGLTVFALGHYWNLGDRLVIDVSRPSQSSPYWSALDSFTTTHV